MEYKQFHLLRIRVGLTGLIRSCVKPLQLLLFDIKIVEAGVTRPVSPVDNKSAPRLDKKTARQPIHVRTQFFTPQYRLYIYFFLRFNEKNYQLFIKALLTTKLVFIFEEIYIHVHKCNFMKKYSHQLYLIKRATLIGSIKVKIIFSIYKFN